MTYACAESSQTAAVPEQVHSGQSSANTTPTTESFQCAENPVPLESCQAAAAATDADSRAEGNEEDDKLLYTRVACRERLRIVNAVRNGVAVALRPDAILAAWEASHLYPFQSNPPYSEEKEKAMWLELCATHSAWVETDPNRSKRITGVVNSPRRCEEMETLTDKYDFRPTPLKASFVNFTSNALTDISVQMANPDDDVGDRIIESNDGPVFDSNARCYVLLDLDDNDPEGVQPQSLTAADSQSLSEVQAQSPASVQRLHDESAQLQS